MAEVSARTKAADRLLTRLHQFTEEDADFWSFRSSTHRLGRHGLCAYPAMMVPEMQGLILDEWRHAVGSGGTVLDPFVGAGTTLVECMRRKISFTGVDINPLAILICNAKTVHRTSGELQASIRRIRRRLENDLGLHIEAKFFGRDKWCSKSLCIALSRIRRGVEREDDAGLRYVCWAVVADLLRKFSNSRSETYKLHVRKVKVDASCSEIIDWFLKRLEIAFDAVALPLSDALLTTKTTPSFVVMHGDARVLNKENLVKAPSLILSSPPYGDNHTTVAYGQFSYMALSWIPVRDVNAPGALYENTRATDFASLGGSYRRTGAHDDLLDASPTYRRLLPRLRAAGTDQSSKKVVSFLGELFESFHSVHSLLEKGGLSIWTIGDRKVAGLKIPLSKILSEAGMALDER